MPPAKPDTPRMTHSAAIDGRSIARLCKLAAAQEDLVKRLQAAYPAYPIRLAATGPEWYRLGGVVTGEKSRIAKDITEWAERTLMECGRDFQTLLKHCEKQNMIATRHRGATLYITIRLGPKAEDFMQVEVDKIQEIADRKLCDPLRPPQDLEELIDPLEPATVPAAHIGPTHYAYRRKTDVAVFMDELGKHGFGKHPAQRFMDDWNRSSAAKRQPFCDDWILKLDRRRGRFGEKVIYAEVVNAQPKALNHLEDLTGKRGCALQAVLARFDRQAGYPFAWYFYMVSRKLVSCRCAEAVHRDLCGDFAYLPERDAKIVQDWIDSPYYI